MLQNLFKASNFCEITIIKTIFLHVSRFFPVTHLQEKMLNKRLKIDKLRKLQKVQKINRTATFLMLIQFVTLIPSDPINFLQKLSRNLYSSLVEHLSVSIDNYSVKSY